MRTGRAGRTKQTNELGSCGNRLLIKKRVLAHAHILWHPALLTL
jgi:hypothetical protein